MNKSYPSLFNFILLFLFSLTIQAKNNVIHNKEVFNVKTSLIFIEEPKDSVIEKKYEELKTLFENNNYSESLQGFLRLNEQVSSSENLMLKFKINSFIDKIYRKTRDYKKAIASYKK